MRSLRSTNDNHLTFLFLRTPAAPEITRCPLFGFGSSAERAKWALELAREAMVGRAEGRRREEGAGPGREVIEERSCNGEFDNLEQGNWGRGIKPPLRSNGEETLIIAGDEGLCIEASFNGDLEDAEQAELGRGVSHVRELAAGEEHESCFREDFALCSLRCLRTANLAELSQERWRRSSLCLSR
ncbi:hypothetical protein L7F22_008907 [Adiantum nelumboides]|nr:hypothetical protein [Adiantum nelumboides]